MESPIVINYLLLAVNLGLMLAGLGLMLFFFWPKNQAALDQAATLPFDQTENPEQQEDDDEDEGDGGGGWEGFDWDAPLDLPPGVYVAPPESTPVPA
jgi:cbb3-type cytochrome oxidase subunit 3